MRRAAERELGLAGALDHLGRRRRRPPATAAMNALAVRRRLGPRWWRRRRCRLGAEGPRAAREPREDLRRAQRARLGVEPPARVHPLAQPGDRPCRGPARVSARRSRATTSSRVEFVPWSIAAATTSGRTSWMRLDRARRPIDRPASSPPAELVRVVRVQTLEPRAACRPRRPTPRRPAPPRRGSAAASACAAATRRGERRDRRRARAFSSPIAPADSIRATRPGPRRGT